MVFKSHLPHELTPWSRVILEKLIVTQIVKFLALSKVNPIHTFSPYFPMIHSDTIFTSTCRSSKWSFMFSKRKVLNE